MNELTKLDMEQAACRDADPDTFFPEGDRLREDTVMAKAICHDCPIKTECLMVAMTHDYQGIWGETTYEERRALRRRTKTINL